MKYAVYIDQTSATLTFEEKILLAGVLNCFGKVDHPVVSAETVELVEVNYALRYAREAFPETTPSAQRLLSNIISKLQA